MSLKNYISTQYEAGLYKFISVYKKTKPKILLFEESDNISKTMSYL